MQTLFFSSMPLHAHIHGPVTFHPSPPTNMSFIPKLDSDHSLPPLHTVRFSPIPAMLISCERNKKQLLQRRPLPTRLALQRNECLDIGGTCTILILGWLAYSFLQQKMCLGVPWPFDPLFSAHLQYGE